MIGHAVELKFQIKPLLPNKVRGVPRADDRKVISGILHYDTELYKSRHLVERLFGRLKARGLLVV